MADQEKPLTESETQNGAEEEAMQQTVAEADAAGVSVGDLEKTLQEKTAALEDMTRKYQRLQADFENFRRRSVKEKEEISVVVAEGIISELLPIVDNFERAIAVEASQDATAIRSGIEMIFRQMNGVFEKLGVSAIESVGRTFDPSEHQAVMKVDDADQEDGLIVEEFQKGYRLKDRVVRPSMVKVVSNS